MAFKYFAVTLLIAAAQAGIIAVHEQHGIPVEHQHHHEQPAFYHAHAPAQVSHVSHAPSVHVAHAVHHREQPAFYHAPAQVAHVSHVPAAQAPHTVHLVQKQHAAHEQYPDDPHPQYNFAYDVEDHVSGDSKSQTESRDGDVVHGEYSLNDADGFRRTVKYTADSVNGFNAVVEREPLTQHKVIGAAPLHQYHHAPAPAHAYAAVPVQHHSAGHQSYEAPHHQEQTHYYHH